MPVFDFKHEESGEVISVYLSLNELKEVYQKQVRDGKVFKRVWEAPLFAKDIKTGSGTSADFKRITQDKNLTVGQMFDRSRELSEKRASKNGGIDPIKEGFYRKYQKNMGKKHPEVIKREGRALVKKNFGITVED